MGVYRAIFERGGTRPFAGGHAHCVGFMQPWRSDPRTRS